MYSAVLAPACASWRTGLLTCGLGIFALAAFPAATPALGQAITIDKAGNPTGQYGAAVDRRFAQIAPTKVELSNAPLDSKTRLELERLLQAEQGFAMRPFPRGHKGLTLQANGKLEPAGEPYLDMVTAEGLCAKPGDRLVITDLKFDHNKMIFMLNGGPDAKHRFLRHVQIGTGSVMSPGLPDDASNDPQGARLTLTFKDRIPEMTDKDVKALLAPLISFDVKTPIQAFTDTLPPKLKDAILNHHVMVGMSTEMVLFAVGQPQKKIREMEGQMPFEEWIYGTPPKDVQFVRVNGNRVIRLEVAKVGEKPQIFDKDEVEGLMRTDGTPLAPAANNTKTVAMGDVVRNPDTQAPAPSPSLRNPGEQLPQDQGQDKSVGTMRPVQFPKQKPDDYPDASKLPRQKPTDQEGQQPATDDSQPAKPDADKPDESKPAPPPSSQPN